MIKFYSTICFFLFFSNSFIVFGGVLRDDGDFEMSLIHFNDFHARFEETSPTSTKCVPEDHDCIGGFPRLYTAIKQLREREPDSILLNAGDDFQGTLWYNVLKWNVTQYFLNMLPVDAHAIGNHEFDDGVAGLVPYLEAMQAPTLIANMDVSEEPTLNGLFQDSTIIERNGVRIGLLGVILQTTPSLANTQNVRFTDEVEAVQRVADNLTAEGVNIIILISHCGLDIDKDIAAKVNNIDIIVGGHSHSLLYPRGETPPSGENAVEDYPVAVNHATGETVLIVQASAYTKYLGNLMVTFDAEGLVKSWSGKPIYLDSSIAQDPEILLEMQPYKDVVDVIGKESIGYSLVDLDRSRCSSGDCNIGNLITDAFVDFCVGMATNDSWTLASIAFINNGGIRTDINRGNITYEDLALSQPFSNQVQTFQLEGKHLMEALEFVATTWSRLQVSGLHIVYNMSMNEYERVVSAKVRCSECRVPVYDDIQPDTLYSIVAPNFLADGGDGYTVISENKRNAVNQGTDIDILVNYFKKHSPLYPEIDERIQMLY